jgi:formamidase
MKKLPFLFLLIGLNQFSAQAQDVIKVGDNALNCLEDPNCINRLHPAITMTSLAKPGDTIYFNSRNCDDIDLNPYAPKDPRIGDPQWGTVHPLAGPVHIEGAEGGDVLKVTIQKIIPGEWAFTLTEGGFLSDEVGNTLSVKWKLNSEYATSDDLPGIRLPNRSFPGIVTVLPGVEQHAKILSREGELLNAGGSVMIPYAKHASPIELCGEGGTFSAECLRTIPPREHGGNLDIRYLQAGVTIYLPCYLPGCGLAIGDVHYIQGDGEVSGTALEMDATVIVTTEILKDGPKLGRGPHYEGSSSLLNIPSERFYATTGLPLKDREEVPSDLAYLASKKIPQLENLSKDISLAAKNALLEIIDYISQTYGYTREEAYLIASVAVDIRIGQLVDVPNVGATAILPLDIFVKD